MADASDPNVSPGNGKRLSAQVQEIAENAWGKLVTRAAVIIGLPLASFFLHAFYQEQQSTTKAVIRMQSGIERLEQRLDDQGRRLDRLEGRVFK